jgi:hypothetical protein
MNLAVVEKITEIRRHPNADRLELIRFGDVLLVTGKHYRVGDLGVWLKPGAQIPGWLARELWLVGVQRANDPFIVHEIPIRGVASPGLWCGQWYRNDSSKESVLHAEDRALGGGTVSADGWIGWGHWNPDWRLGDYVDAELGVVPAPEEIAV